MDIELLTFTLAAGATAQLAKAGRYVEVIVADYPIASLTLTDENGGQSAFVRNALSGLYAEVPFKQLDIVNGSTAQTITLLVTDGRGGTRRQPGQVSVVEAIPPTVQTGGGSLASLAITAGASTQLVVPTPGVTLTLRGFVANITSGAAGTSQTKLIAAPAPVSTFVGNFIVFGDSGNVPAGQTGLITNLDMNKRLPVGWGLYQFAAIAGAPAAAGSAIVCYDAG